MEINVNHHGIYPDGQDSTSLWLWSAHNPADHNSPPPDRTNVPVWLALQILINRASVTGGRVYLPAASWEMPS